MNYLKKLEVEVSAWPNISVHPHRFGGREFLFGRAEVGHVHTRGIADIPFPRSIRDALLAEGLAEEHYWVPNSGWITFRVRSEDDLKHSVWLMRLSYLRYALRTSPDPHKMFAEETENLRLSPRFKSLLEPFVAKTPNSISAERLSA
ncbi:MAG: luciferase family protein [Candidatus Sulfotelmatobacter sp.]